MEVNLHSGWEKVGRGWEEQRSDLTAVMGWGEWVDLAWEGMGLEAVVYPNPDPLASAELTELINENLYQ